MSEWPAWTGRWAEETHGIRPVDDGSGSLSFPDWDEKIMGPLPTPDSMRLQAPPGPRSKLDSEPAKPLEVGAVKATRAAISNATTLPQVKAALLAYFDARLDA